MSSTKRTRSKNSDKLVKTNRGDKIIRLPIDSIEYKELSEDPAKFRAKIADILLLHPELFPCQIAQGYEFHDKRKSKKQDFTHRRIRLKDGSIYALYSYSWLPYMSSSTTTSWYPLLLIYFGVPLWVIVLGFQRDELHWYRQFKHFGRFSIIGTSIKHPQKIPHHIAADEKFTWLRGKEIYVAMIAGLNCLLGISICEKSDEESLVQAYSIFKQESKVLNRYYQLLSFVTDGWSATSNAIKGLFKNATWTLCFLHSIIKIRNLASKEPQKRELFDKIWQVYKQENKADFTKKMDDFKQWTTTNIEKKSILEQVEKMHQKTNAFTACYEQKLALRTSNTIDRPMKIIDRFLFCHQYFHGHLASAELMLRAFAIVYNFAPFAPRTTRDKPNYRTSRMANLNGFNYKENWLENLMLSASCNGKLTPHQIS